MMFCGNCGANNPDGSMVCGSCGAALTGGAPANPASAVADQVAEVKKGGAGKVIAIVVAAVAAVAVVMLLLSMLLGGGAKGNAVKAIKATCTKNGGKTIVSLMPKKVLEEAMDQQDMTKKELIEELNDNLENVYDSLEDELGKNFKVTVKALDSIPLKKIDEDRYDDLKDRYEDDFDIKISDAQRVYLYSKASGKDGVDADINSITMVKIGMGWYVDVYSFNTF